MKANVRKIFSACVARSKKLPSSVYGVMKRSCDTVLAAHDLLRCEYSVCGGSLNFQSCKLLSGSLAAQKSCSTFGGRECGNKSGCLLRQSLLNPSSQGKRLARSG